MQPTTNNFEHVAMSVIAHWPRYQKLTCKLMLANDAEATPTTTKLWMMSAVGDYAAAMARLMHDGNRHALPAAADDLLTYTALYLEQHCHGEEPLLLRPSHASSAWGLMVRVIDSVATRPDCVLTDVLYLLYGAVDVRKLIQDAIALMEAE